MRLFRLVALAILFSASALSIPVPTQQQTRWLADEIGCFVHYNMATMIGGQGCSGAPPPVDQWNPSSLDTDQWVDVCASMEGRRIVYVAKHGCGFAAWKSNVSGYNYSSSYAPNSVDVVARVAESARAKGLGYGYYYSVVSNAYANVKGGVVQPGPIDPTRQINVTQEEYDMLVVAHLTELYAHYGNLTEVWFDGGYQKQLTPALRSLFSELQPNVVAFQGPGLVSSPVRWVGSETGYAPYPCWSTCDYDAYGAGSPNASTFYPAETDFTLQNSDNWFYNPTSGVRSGAELRKMYETSVGSNTALIIDMAPYPNGTVPQAQVVAAKALGDFVRGCYRSPPLATSGAPTSTRTVTVHVDNATAIDRIAVREDQSRGQLVLSYTLSALMSDGTTKQLPCGGQSVGNKRIDLLPSPVTDVASVTLQVTSTVGDAMPSVALDLLACSDLAHVIDALPASKQ